MPEFPTFTVSGLNQYIKSVLDRDEFLNGIFVRGEISNYKCYPSGHHYFSLKDAEGTLRCVMFRREAMNLKFRPVNGMRVAAFGRVTVFPRDGQYQLYCSQMSADGIGDLAAAFEELKEKLNREGLFALSMMERELIPEERQAHFRETLETVMLREPGNWQKHYRGSEEELRIKRAYSFSDRCRYYFAMPEVNRAIEKLFDNLRSVRIPLSMLRQYMPQQYVKVRDGVLSMDPKELAEDCVVHLVEDYNYATKLNYMIGDAFIR